MENIRRRLLDKAACRRTPILGAFELLPVCNFQCRMCYVRRSMAEVRQAGGLMSGEEWLDIASQGREAGVLLPLLTGGEPLLHPDFRQIMSGLDAMGMRISINTNGSLIDRDMARFFSAHRPDRINITLYGASEESYEALCGNGEALGRIREGVRLLKEYGIPIKFNTSITPLNAHELGAMIDYARQEQCVIQPATYMFPPCRRDSSMVGQNHRMTPEEAGRVRVLADRRLSGENAFLTHAAVYSRFVPLEELEDKWSTERELPMRCRAGVCSFWVDWQGNLGSCGMYSPVKVGLKGRGFADAWQEVVEKTAALRYHPACAGCPNYLLCHPCLAMVNNECGSHTGRPDYVCRMNQAAANCYRELAGDKMLALPVELPAREEICEL